MAIIKCPECGHQISDKAPVCPSCGVEIAGKVTKCSNCGEVYFTNMGMCPNCHEQKSAQPVRPVIPPAMPVTPQMPPATPVTPQDTAVAPPMPPVRRPQTGNNANSEGNDDGKGKKKNGRGVIIISLIFAVIVCGIFYYFYDNANKSKEKEAYEYAMQSSDPMVLQSYLDTYKDADEAHRDSIMAHLDLLKQVAKDWTNAVVSGSKEALEAYLQKYPNSPHKEEIWDKIDSIDWNVAKAADNVDAYQIYLDAHTDGTHIEEAENALKKVKSRDLQPEEKQMVSNVFRRFFQSINSRDAVGLSAICEDILSSLLGKSSATNQDVVTFMNKLYKDNVANMNWYINDDYQIKKREVGDEDYEYQVQFSARQDIDLTDGAKKNNLFKINAVVSPAGKISSFNMSKVNTEE